MTIQRKDLANEFGNKEKFQLLIRLVGKIKQACTWTQKGQITRVERLATQSIFSAMQLCLGDTLKSPLK